MIEDLKLPDLPKERLEFGNNEHLKIVKQRELFERLKNNKKYMKWRNEREFYTHILNDIHVFKVGHLSDKFNNRLKDLNELLEKKEDEKLKGLETNKSYTHNIKEEKLKELEIKKGCIHESNN